MLLKDVDLIRWRQDLIEDRNRLATLHSLQSRSARHGTPSSMPSARSSARSAASPSTQTTASSLSSRPSPTRPITCTASLPPGRWRNWVCTPPLSPVQATTGPRCQISARTLAASSPPSRLAQGASRGPGRGRRSRSAHRHRLYQRRSEPPRLRHGRQFRHPLEPRPHYPAIRPDRPYWLLQ